MDRFSALTVFRRVVELESFSAAADDLNYSKAAVSKIIKDLEAGLGAQLIVRTTRSLHLTDTGQAYFEKVSDILDAVAAADDGVRSESGSPQGRLKISAPMSFGLVTVAKMLPRFARQYPGIEVDLVMNDRLVDLVQDGFDLAIRGGQLADSSLKARKLTDIERVLCASPDYLEAAGTPEDPADLAGHASLAFSVSATPDTWSLVSGSRRQSVTVNVKYRANNSMAIRQAALKGLGIALIPVAYVREDLADGGLVNVLPDWRGEPQGLFAVYPAHRESSLKIRLLVDFLRDEFAAIS
ncbi:LysR family transcriptional regulator [Hyphomonas sp. GM-8P]|uniref:LysR family transcriptional regulator n=1 Tax=Hyphomonas sp. GM-8P TaxID=1280945 RepID=UPI000DC01025|nr:LysR family transcriptional regulator [Hyphomonas sp. GM-8P]RAN37978.1 hypothetical protein HY26_04575 [Hyphomonas sp. GM-8P]